MCSIEKECEEMLTFKIEEIVLKEISAQVIFITTCEDEYDTIKWVWDILRTGWIWNAAPVLNYRNYWWGTKGGGREWQRRFHFLNFTLQQQQQCTYILQNDDNAATILYTYT